MEIEEESTQHQYIFTKCYTVLFEFVKKANLFLNEELDGR